MARDPLLDEVHHADQGRPRVAIKARDEPELEAPPLGLRQERRGPAHQDGATEGLGGAASLGALERLMGRQGSDRHGEIVAADLLAPSAVEPLIEQLEVLDSSENWWLACGAGGAEGLVPSNYVRLVAGGAGDAAPPPGDLSF